MKKLISSAFLLFITSFLNAQTLEEPVKSGELIDKGIKLHDDGDIEGALEFYEKVPRNDTNYVLALYERSLSVYSLKRYDDAIAIAREGLTFKSIYDHSFYVTLGNALDDNGDGEEALKVFDEGIKRFPYNIRIRFNKAVALNKMEKYQEAVDELKQIITINPLHPGSHLLLASICKKSAKLVEAMLAYNTFLLLEPGSERALSVVGTLDQLTSEKLSAEVENVVFSKEGDDFSDLEVYLYNRLAMNAKFKVPVKLNFMLVRQNYFLFSHFKDNINKYKDGFFSNFYIPFFVSVVKNGWFDEFTYYELMLVNDNSVQALLKKNLANVKKFIDWAFIEYRKSTRKQERMFDGSLQIVDHWVFRTSHLEAMGRVKDEKTNTRIGTWNYFNSAGSLSGEHFYTSDGKKTGTWKDYYSDGELFSELTYENGVAEGFYKAYFKNGKLKTFNDTKNDKIHGLARDYFFDGTLRAETSYKDGKAEGPAKVFYAINTIRYELNYSNNLLNGPVTEYYSDGLLKMKGNYKNGEMDGEFLYYWPNGKLQATYKYVAGKTQGAFEAYHDNGQLHKKGNVKNGTIIGEYKTWYRNGNPDEEHEYDENGKGNGKERQYDLDGKVFYESETKKDIIVSFKCFDKTGKVIKEGKEDKGVLDYVYHYPDGEKKSEGQLKKGKKDGLWKFYDRLGNISSEEKYKDGETLETTTFYRNGKINTVTRYKDGEQHGYYESYFYNGNPYIKGWMIKGEMEGYWYYYNQDGTLEKKLYYLKGDQYGPQLEYAPGVKLTREYDCDLEGRTIKYTYYDTSGLKYQEVDFKATTGDLIIKHMNGNEKFKGGYKNDFSHGTYVWHYSNGKIETEGEYYSNRKTGAWKWYSLEGKLTTTGFYFKGDRDSTWTSYYEDGKIKNQRFYRSGDQVGEWIEYYENGQIASKKTYKDGERTGPSTYYGEDGQLRMIKEFFHNDVISISYMLPSGEMSAPIKVGNDPQKIVTYYKNGKKADEYSVNKNELDGEYIEYHSNGNIREKSNYKLGFTEGPSETYYSNGKIKARENNYHDNLHGVCKYYDVNGVISSELIYSNNDLHGVCKYYKNGVLNKIRVYYDGLFIYEKNV